MKKTNLFISLVVLYLILYGIYLWLLQTITMLLSEQKAWNYGCISGLVITMMVFYTMNIKDVIFQQFFIISFGILLMTFGVIVAVQLSWITNPYRILLIFYGGVIVFSLLILKILNNKNN